jgi:hypothetical protein
VAKVAKSLAVRSCGSSSAQAAAAAGAKQKLDQHVFTGKYVIKVRQEIQAVVAAHLDGAAAGYSYCTVVTLKPAAVCSACMYACART